MDESTVRLKFLISEIDHSCIFQTIFKLLEAHLIKSLEYFFIKGGSTAQAQE